MVVGIGIDLVEWARLERSLERWGDRLVAKLMDADEAQALPLQGEARVQALALAVAGKEAASKALGTGWSLGVRWRDVVVGRGPSPSVRLAGRAAEVARQLGSSGEALVSLEIRGSLAIGEVWLLS
jgi:holo-[acyl-carrier protein] synthase